MNLKIVFLIFLSISSTLSKYSAPYYQSGEVDDEQITVAEAGPDNPNLDRTTINELCSLSPEKGDGIDDVIRFYFNPIVQQCLPFSYTGHGGNANRFVSIKNCYEICHPAETTVEKPRVVSGVKAYFVSNWKELKQKAKQINESDQPGDIVVRKIKNPADPSKTLTIIQKAHYVYGPKSGVAVVDDGYTTKIVPTKKPKIKIIQRIHRYTGPTMNRQIRLFNNNNACQSQQQLMF